MVGHERSHDLRTPTLAHPERQYLDLLTVRSWRVAPGAETGPGPGLLGVFGRQMRFDLAGWLSAADHQARALQIGGAGADLVPQGPDQRRLAPGAWVLDLGRMGRRRRRTRPGPTASNGGPGRRPMAGRSIRSPMSSDIDPRGTRRAAAISSAPGTPPTWRRWPCRPATACSSSMWRMAGCPASSISAPPTSS